VEGGRNYLIVPKKKKGGKPQLKQFD